MSIIAESKFSQLKIKVTEFNTSTLKFSGIVIKNSKTFKVGFFYKNWDLESFTFKVNNKSEMKNKKSVLLQAESIVNNDRNEQYGDANEAFELYSTILKTTFGIELTPSEVCKVMIAVKLGRLKYKHKEDSVVDACGYLELLNRLETNSK